MSLYSRDMYCHVGFVSGLVRQSPIIVGTCSSKSAYCRDLFFEVVGVTVCVRRIRLSVGTWSEM